MSLTWSRFENPGNLTVRIAEHIREMIVTDQLAVGEKLPSERELSRMLGVSRPALREAVKLLEASGQLAVQHGVGVFVAAVEPDLNRASLAEPEGTLTELFAMREVLETAAAGWAAETATTEQIATLTAAVETHEHALNDLSDSARLAELNTDFHLEIVRIAGNRYLSRTVGILHEMIAAGMQTTLPIPGRVEQSMREHRTILEAIVAHDPEAARRAIAAHIHSARDSALVRVRSSAGDPA